MKQRSIMKRITLIAVASSGFLIADEKADALQAINASVSAEKFSVTPKDGDLFSAERNVSGFGVDPESGLWGATQLFIWGETRSIELLWWRSSHPTMRKYLFLLLLIASSDDEIVKTIDRFLEFSGRFAEVEKAKRVTEIIEGIDLVNAGARIIRGKSKFGSAGEMPVNIARLLEHSDRRNIEMLFSRYSRLLPESPPEKMGR